MRKSSCIYEKKHGRRVAVGVACLMALCMSTQAMTVRSTAEEARSWYCARAKDHAQPRADAPLATVEEHGGYYIDHRHTDPEADDKVVYLTFDAGYENGNVERVLDTLRDTEVPGAFFILGHLACDNAPLVRRMADEGHLVCNHTYTHKNLTGGNVGSLAEELGRLEKACRDQAGVEVAHYFRPPEGKFDAAMLMEAERLGYKTIFWSFAYADWDNQHQPDPAAARKKILDNIHNGAVILLHPTSATNAAILGDVINTLREQGYRFGTLDELTADHAETSPTTDGIPSETGVGTP